MNGHDHDYERFAPQDPGGHEDRARGIREFVVGTGGATLRPFGTTVANSELRVAGTYGVLKLTLKSERLRLGVHPGHGGHRGRGSGALPLTAPRVRGPGRLGPPQRSRRLPPSACSKRGVAAFASNRSKCSPA